MVGPVRFALRSGLHRMRHSEEPIGYFRMFYADTALFGGKSATRCGLDFFESTVFCLHPMYQ